jgi:hypothetical protein
VRQGHWIKQNEQVFWHYTLPRLLLNQQQGGVLGAALYTCEMPTHTESKAAHPFLHARPEWWALLFLALPDLGYGKLGHSKLGYSKLGEPCANVAHDTTKGTWAVLAPITLVPCPLPVSKDARALVRR